MLYSSLYYFSFFMYSSSEISLIVITFFVFFVLSLFSGQFVRLRILFIPFFFSLLIFRSFKIEIKVEKEKVDTIKIFFLIIVFFAWIYFLERTGFVLTSLIAFNLLILVNSGLKAGIKKIFLYMIFGSIFVLLLYFGFKNLLLVPLPEGLWLRDL